MSIARRHPRPFPLRRAVLGGGLAAACLGALAQGVGPERIKRGVVLLAPHDPVGISISGGPWTKARGPFGSPGTTCPLQSTVQTLWPVGTTLSINRHFTVPANAQRVLVNVATDRDVQVYVNKYIDDTGIIINWQPCSTRTGQSMDATIMVHPGDNLLEVDAFGNSDHNYVAVSITADVEVDSVAP